MNWAPAFAESVSSARRDGRAPAAGNGIAGLVSELTVRDLLYMRGHNESDSPGAPGEGHRSEGAARCFVWVAGLALAGLSAAQAADLTVSPQGAEYALSRLLLGDQTRPSLGINAEGGYAAWQDNAVDGQGLGIMAARLNASLSPIPNRIFRVNEQAGHDQENPVVQLLPSNAAVIVWQGGKLGEQDIWARFLNPDGTFATKDVRVNSLAAGQQANPAVAALEDGSIVVVWNSEAQDGDMLGVYGQRLSAAGQLLGSEFRVNEFVAYNQRTPAVTALEDGRFVVAWVSEQQRAENSVDVYARFYQAGGEPDGHEFRLNATANLCANPALATGWNGGFLAVWSERALANLTNMWDVVAGKFDASGQSAPYQPRINTYEPHNQFSPRIASLGRTRLVVWNSLWQDGSRDGVYGRIITEDGGAGDEFRVATTTAGQQMQPCVASDGVGRFLVAWSGFVGGATSYEILGQRYSGETQLAAPLAPVLSPLDSYSLLISWTPLAGYPELAGYRVFIDGAATPVVTAENFHVLNDLDPASTHTARIAYALDDGRVSPASPSGSGTTWGRDRNHDGLPDDWQTAYWGAESSAWPGALVDSDGDGAATLAEFLSGTDPADAASVLRVSIQPASVGFLVQWNAVPGSVYQLQSSLELETWADAAGPAFAAGNEASSVVAATAASVYYRVIRVR